MVIMKDDMAKCPYEEWLNGEISDSDSDDGDGAYFDPRAMAKCPFEEWHMHQRVMWDSLIYALLGQRA
jgi:hypothetical protein